MRIYLAHPYGGDKENLDLAMYMMKSIQDRDDDVTVIADWILDCMLYSDADPRQRKAAMDRNLERIDACQQLWVTGGLDAIAKSRGIRQEVEYAMKCGIPVRYVSLAEMKTLEIKIFNPQWEEAVAA